jgi:hypothetical protein
MTEFEQALDACLYDLEQGASNVDQCLARHPKHAAQLKPILLLTEAFEQGRAIEPSPAFKARTRARLTLHMQAHPRRSAQAGFSFWRFAASLATIVLALLATGTVYAQNALPGDLLYNWKLTSEAVWRAVSPDPVGTDLAIANRRMDEMNAVANDPVRSALALEGYQEVLTRLQAELDVEMLEQILPQLEIEQEPVENPEQLIPTLPVSPAGTSIPGLPLDATARPNITTNTPLPGLPTILPTERPQIIPTIEIPNSPPPEIIPTLQPSLPLP